MKAEIYIFGSFANGYSQYPDNYTRNLFKTVSDSRKGVSEIIYHREGALTYYIYLREISKSSNSFLGMCYVFNDIIIRDFPFLFEIFEDAITNIVVKGEILEFANNGDLSTKVNQLYTNTEELQRISDYLNGKLSSLGKYAAKLPPANYSVSTSEWKSFTYDQLTGAKATIDTYSNIRIIKGDNYDSDTLKGYAAKLKSQDTNIRNLQEEVVKLKDENAQLNRKKKQFLTVIILSSLLLIGSLVTAVVIANKNSDINNKIATIESLQRTKASLESQIVQLNGNIEELNDEITELEKKNTFEHNRYIAIQEEYDTLTSLIIDRQPIIVTRTSFDFSSGWFTLKYYGMVEGYKDIRINVYNDNGSRVRSEYYRDRYFYEGENTMEFYITSSLYSSDWYYFEVSIGNVIIGGGRH